MKWWTKLIFLVAISTLFATTYFINWTGGIRDVISDVNESFWSKMPFEFTVIITGFIIVIIIGTINWIIRD